MEPSEAGQSMGHGAIGVVEDRLSSVHVFWISSRAAGIVALLGDSPTTPG